LPTAENGCFVQGIIDPHQKYKEVKTVDQKHIFLRTKKNAKIVVSAVEESAYTFDNNELMKHMGNLYKECDLKSELKDQAITRMTAGGYVKRTILMYSYIVLKRIV